MNTAARGGGASTWPTLSTTWLSTSLFSEARRLDAQIHCQFGGTLSPLTKKHIPRQPCCSLWRCGANRKSNAFTLNFAPVNSPIRRTNLRCKWLVPCVWVLTLCNIWFDLLDLQKGRNLIQNCTEKYALHEMTKGYIDVRVCIEQGQDGERKYCCAFFLNSDNRVDDWMCFGRMLKMCDAKYNGEDWKRVELALGSWKKFWWRREWSSLARG